MWCVLTDVILVDNEVCLRHDLLPAQQPCGPSAGDSSATTELAEGNMRQAAPWESEICSRDGDKRQGVTNK